MKKSLLFLILAGSLLSCKEESKEVAKSPQVTTATAATDDTIILNNEVYASLASGLSVREKPDASAAVIGTFAYGETIGLPPVPSDPADLPERTSVPVNIAGMNTYWVQIMLNGKPGYVIAAYVSEYAPPAKGTKDLKAWAEALSKPFGAAFISRPKAQTFLQDGIGVYRQLYQNGTVYTEEDGYEYFATALQLPNTTVLKAFNCLRGLEDFAPLFKSNAPLKKGSYTVPDAQISEGYQWVTTYDATGQYLRSITISWSDGGYSTLTITQLETEVIVGFSSGV